MRITTSQLRRIIKEEARRTLREAVATTVPKQIGDMIKSGKVPPAEMIAQAMHDFEHPSVELYLPAAKILVNALKNGQAPDGQALEDALKGRAKLVGTVITTTLTMLGLPLPPRLQR